MVVSGYPSSRLLSRRSYAALPAGACAYARRGDGGALVARPGQRRVPHHLAEAGVGGLGVLRGVDLRTAADVALEAAAAWPELTAIAEKLRRMARSTAR